MKTLNIEIDERVINRLLANGELCVADFKCLDCESKACAWKMALDNASDLCALGAGGQRIDVDGLKTVSRKREML